MRLSTDQRLENAIGVGAPPRGWPRQELVIDLPNKGIYALTAGLVADRLVAEQPRPPAKQLQPRRQAEPGEQRGVEEVVDVRDPSA